MYSTNVTTLHSTLVMIAWSPSNCTICIYYAHCAHALGVITKAKLAVGLLYLFNHLHKYSHYKS